MRVLNCCIGLFAGLITFGTVAAYDFTYDAGNIEGSKSSTGITYTLSVSKGNLGTSYDFDTKTGVTSGAPSGIDISVSSGGATGTMEYANDSLPTSNFTISMNGKLLPPSGGEGSQPTWGASGNAKAPYYISPTEAEVNGDNETVTFTAKEGGNSVSSNWTISPSWDGYTPQNNKTSITIGKNGDWKPLSANNYTITASKVSESNKTANATLKYDCSKEYSEITIGPFHITFSPALKGEFIGDDTYRYTVSQGTTTNLSASITDKFSTTLGVAAVNVSFTIKNDILTSANVSWNGEKECSDISLFSAKIKALSGTLTSSGFSGSVTFDGALNNDVEYNGYYKITLKKGASGTLTYNYNSASTGAWAFNISGLKANIMLDSQILAEGTIGGIDQDGECKNISLSLKNSGPYNIGGFKFSVNTFSANFDYDFIAKSGKLRQGIAKATLEAPKNIGGKIVVDATLKETSADLSVAGKKIPAFGGEISGEIEVLSQAFMEITSISGSGLQFIHGNIKKKDGTSLSGCAFNIANGELKSLSLASAIIKYSGFYFDMTGASYSNDIIALSANCQIGSTINMGVDNFKIESAGDVSFSKINADINKAPLSISGALTQSSSSVSGNLNASISGAGFQTIFSLGATNEYNYGTLGLSVSSSTGIPLGNSGFKLTGLGGVAAYNHTVSPSGATSYRLGSPSLNTHAAGVHSTIADVSNFASLSGGILIVLGNNPTFTINGAVNVPATGAKYFNGNASVSYAFGDNSTQGTLSSTINVPAGSGSVLKMNNATLDFLLYGRGDCRVFASASGKLLSVVDLSIEDLKYRCVSGTYSGSSRGTLSFSTEGQYAYPAGFGTGSNNSNTNWAGFGIYWRYDFGVSGGHNITLSSDNYTGQAYGEVNGSFDVYAKWDGILWIGGTEAYCNAALNGRLDISAASGQGVQASGTLAVAYQNERESIDFSCQII